MALVNTAISGNFSKSHQTRGHGNPLRCACTSDLRIGEDREDFDLFLHRLQTAGCLSAYSDRYSLKFEILGRCGECAASPAASLGATP